MIQDQLGIDRTTVAGPYSEGDIVTLRCDVYGGRPVPTVSWFRDGNPLVAESKNMPLSKHLRSEIVLGPLSRQDLHSKLVCKASNHERATAVEQSVQIDMNCGFALVWIQQRLFHVEIRGIVLLCCEDRINFMRISRN